MRNSSRQGEFRKSFRNGLDLEAGKELDKFGSKEGEYSKSEKVSKS